MLSVEMSWGSNKNIKIGWITISFVFLFISFPIRELFIIVSLVISISTIIIMALKFKSPVQGNLEKPDELIQCLSEKDIYIAEGLNSTMQNIVFYDGIIIDKEAVEKLNLRHIKALIRHEEGHDITKKIIAPIQVLLYITFPLASLYTSSIVTLTLVFILFQVCESILTYLSEALADIYSIKKGYRSELEEIYGIEDTDKIKIHLFNLLTRGYPSQEERSLWFKKKKLRNIRFK